MSCPQTTLEQVLEDFKSGMNDVARDFELFVQQAVSEEGPEDSWDEERIEDLENQISDLKDQVFKLGREIRGVPRKDPTQKTLVE